MNQESLKIKKSEPLKKTIKQPIFEYSTRPLVIVIIFPYTTYGKKMANHWYSEFQKIRSKITVTNYIYLLFEVYGRANLGYLFNCGFQIPNIFDFNVIFHSPHFIPSSSTVKYYNLSPKIPIVIDNSNYITVMISQQHFQKIKGFSIIEETPLALKVNFFNQLLSHKLAIHILNNQDSLKINTPKRFLSQQTILANNQSSKLVHFKECQFSFFYTQKINDDSIYYLGTQCQLFKNPELSLISKTVSPKICLRESLQKIKESYTYLNSFWRPLLRQENEDLFKKVIQENNLESIFLTKNDLLHLPIEKLKSSVSILPALEFNHNSQRFKNKRVLFIQNQDFLGEYLDKYYLWITKRWLGLSSSEKVDYLLVNKKIEKKSKIKLGVRGNINFYEVSYSSLKIWNQKYDYIINGQYFQALYEDLSRSNFNKFIQKYHHSLFITIGQNLKTGGTFQSFLYIPPDYQQLYQLESLYQLFENHSNFIFRRPYLIYRVHLKNYQPKRFVTCFQKFGSFQSKNFQYSLTSLVYQLCIRCQDLLNFWKFISTLYEIKKKGKLNSTMSCGIITNDDIKI